MEEKKTPHKFADKTCGECARLCTRYIQIGEQIHLQYFCRKRATNGRDDSACRNFVGRGI